MDDFNRSLHYLFETIPNWPQSGSVDERNSFEELQNNFAEQFSLFFPDHLAPKAIVVIPSLTLDREVLSKVAGAIHYEERLLCLLMLLRMPRTHVTYVSSIPIDPVIIDYYLHLLPGITGFHARERLTLLSCYDGSSVSLTEKILFRPRLVERIRRSIPEGFVAHLACFNTTAFEQTLAVQLGIPVYGCDPALNHLGTKTGSRKIFREANVSFPAGSEDLHSIDEVNKALIKLKQEQPEIKKAVIKLNDGFSGDGNALFIYPDQIPIASLDEWLNENIETQVFPIAEDLPIPLFFEKLASMGGIVESFISGEIKMSPSVQCRINPLGEIDIISTHDQVLGGSCGQVFLGAHFPAHEAYRVEIGLLGRKIAEKLSSYGVLGRFSIDFISVKNQNGWMHYAIEINLRKGGTTHPYLMMQFLTNGKYNEKTGKFITPSEQTRHYFASDNVQSEKYKGLTPQDLIEIAMFHGLHFDGATQKGVMFHLVGALSQYGKMGMVCVGETAEEAFCYYEKTITVLDAESSYPKSPH
jgi:hypothetical protein